MKSLALRVKRLERLTEESLGLGVVVRRYTDRHPSGTLLVSGSPITRRSDEAQDDYVARALALSPATNGVRVVDEAC